MADLPDARSALAGAYAEGTFGIASVRPITFAERRNLVIVQVSAFADTAADVGEVIAGLIGVRPPSQPNTVALAGGDGSQAALLWTGPERWLAVAPDDGNARLAARLQTALPASRAAVTDLSSARTVIRLRGGEASNLLAKHCGLDFHPHRFGTGACAQTRIAHVGVLIHRIDDSGFDVFVARSYALDFWELLIDAAGEFGYRVTQPVP